MSRSSAGSSRLDQARVLVERGGGDPNTRRRVALRVPPAHVVEELGLRPAEVDAHGQERVRRASIRLQARHVGRETLIGHALVGERRSVPVDAESGDRVPREREIEVVAHPVAVGKPARQHLGAIGRAPDVVRRVEVGERLGRRSRRDRHRLAPRHLPEGSAVHAKEAHRAKAELLEQRRQRRRMPETVGLPRGHRPDSEILPHPGDAHLPIAHQRLAGGQHRVRAREPTADDPQRLARGRGADPLALAGMIVPVAAQPRDLRDRVAVVGLVAEQVERGPKDPLDARVVVPVVGVEEVEIEVRRLAHHHHPLGAVGNAERRAHLALRSRHRRRRARSAAAPRRHEARESHGGEGTKRADHGCVSRAMPATARRRIRRRIPAVRTDPPRHAP